MVDESTEINLARRPASNLMGLCRRIHVPVFPTKYLMTDQTVSQLLVILIHQLKQILMLLLDHRKLLTFLFLTGKMSRGSSFYSLHGVPVSGSDVNRLKI
jgi:hypothetical protein